MKISIRKKVTYFVETIFFQRFIVSVIILNSVTLGLETSPGIMRNHIDVLGFLDILFLSIFTLELFLKFYAYRFTFFKSGWNIFDFLIVGISYLPLIEGLSVLRSLRILRVLRLLSVLPALRKVTQAFFASLSGLATVGAILLLIFYVGAVLSTKLFGEEFPDWFGNIGSSLFSLFQIMTLESWSSGIARPVMDVYPFAWLFFVLFILSTTFVALNLLIGVIVNSMQTLHQASEDAISKKIEKQDSDRLVLRKKLEEMEQTIKDVKNKL